MNEAIENLFMIFDTNDDDQVDAHELIAGISVLCPGSQTDKTAVVFKLFGE